MCVFWDGGVGVMVCVPIVMHDGARGLHGPDGWTDGWVYQFLVYGFFGLRG